MKHNKSSIIESRAIAICEEFCRYVVADTVNESILVNVNVGFYDELINRLNTLGYVQMFVASVHPKHTVTVAFVKTIVE